MDDNSYQYKINHEIQIKEIKGHLKIQKNLSDIHFR